jgi:hypothetical protein
MRAYPDLAHPHYSVRRDKKGRQVVSIGEYDPTIFVMVLAAFVGPATKRIADNGAVDYSIQNLVIRSYNVVVMWSFFGPHPSVPVGFIGHFFTEQDHPDPDFRAFFDHLMLGLNEEDCKAWFLNLRQAVQFHMCEFAGDPSRMIHMRFFRIGL